MDFPLKKWPKLIAPLTPEQQAISDDFMHYWHEVLPKKYGIVDEFNHSYPVKNAPKHFSRTLEIGAGNGEHLKYEKLSDAQLANYYTVDIRANMLAEIQKKFPKVNAVLADCQKKLEFADDYFDRIIAIHVLEHLPNLPAAIQELYRVCDKKNGTLSVVIPCEGSLAYTLARRISAQRIFESRYKQSYHWLIKREHINLPKEIMDELRPYFTIVSTAFFPLIAPFNFCNLCIGMTLVPVASV